MNNIEGEILCSDIGTRKALPVRQLLGTECVY